MSKEANGSRPRPTLVETLLLLSRDHQQFGALDEQALRSQAEEFYAQELGRLGEHLVARGTITRDQLALGLAKQAMLHGETAKAVEYLDRLTQEIHGRATAIAGQVSALFGRLQGVRLS